MSFELDNNLPQNWGITTIGELTLPYQTAQPKKEPETEFKYVDIGSIDNNTNTITNPKTFLGKDAPSRARRIVAKGDILFSTVRTYLKNIARVSDDLDGILTSTGIAVLRASFAVDSNFLFYFVLSDKFIRNISSAMDGTLYPAVTDSDVASANIPLPPLNEQKRIVGKIEALQRRSQRVKEAIDAIPQLLDQFRQSVLAAAFRGDLTADWRENNPDVEPASVLLEKIQEKRFELAKTSREISIVKKAYQEEAKLLSQQKSSDLPATWVNCTINSVGNVCNGSTPSRKVVEYWGGSISWVSSGEVYNNLIYETREKITEIGYKNSSVKILPKGTVLLAMIGQGKTRGQTSILQIEATINQNIAAIILNHHLVLSEYLWYWFQYQYTSTRELGSGSGPQALNCQRVREIPLILAPLNEQLEVVRRIKSLIKSLEVVTQQYQETKGNLDQLNQSILKKAFRGKLVPQSPNDEPASILLERIRAEREKLQQQTKAVKKSKTKTTKRRSKKAPQKPEEAIQLELPGMEE